jgi:nucleoside-diphosphate-sugar epimerase
MYQKRPYLSVEDAVAALFFIIEKRLFDGSLYNIVTENLTVNDVVTWIQKHINDIKINLVDAEIMNQLSYEASSRRFRALGFDFSGSIANNINDTIALLKGAGGLHD